jgi:ribosome-binding protein aMBF1 (putative translation factor)
MITGRQVSAARKLLGWTRETLAAHAHVAQSIITICERGEEKQSEMVVDAIQDALEAAGVEFLDQNTVRLKLAS